jgi:tetratricopeptide (TPR) repeat protein
MTSGPGSSWRDSVARRRAAVLALALLAGCSTVQRVSSDASRVLEEKVTLPVRYRLAGADRDARVHIERGQGELEARSYRAAIVAFNRAMWSVERIADRSLRLAELIAVYDGLRRAYFGLGVSDFAEEHGSMAGALAGAAARHPSGEATQGLGRAKEAYASARFRDAVREFRRALVDLEDVAEFEARVGQLAEARCYLALSYFAAQDHQRVREELRRLTGFDPAMSACAREAPPGLRALIAEVQKRPQDL